MEHDPASALPNVRTFGIRWLRRSSHSDERDHDDDDLHGVYGGASTEHVAPPPGSSGYQSGPGRDRR